MPHWDNARAAIEKRIQDNWTMTPIRYWSSGAPFIVPSTAYIAVRIDEFDGHQITLGSTPQVHRYIGQIVIQVLVPERSGAAVALGYCESLDDLFRRAQFSYLQSGMITCRTPQVRDVGIQQGWYQVNLIIPYHRDRSH